VGIQEGIEINANPRNEYFLEAIKSARYPQREESSQATTPIALPIHDWTSTHRTVLEYFFMNIEAYRTPLEEPPSWARKMGNFLTSRKSFSTRRR
jgi:hypothetical protein